MVTGGKSAPETGLRNRLLQKAGEQAMYMRKLPMKNSGIFKKTAGFIYTLIGRKGIGKLFYINKKCGSCTVCATVCPNNAVKIGRFGPSWSFKCKGCLTCAAACPGRGIEVSALKFIAVIILIFLPYDAWLEQAAGIRLAVIFGQVGGFVASFIVWGAGYAAALFVMDRLLSVLFGFDAVKKVLNTGVFKKLRSEIDPLTIFPIVLTNHGIEKLRQAGLLQNGAARQ